MDRGSCLLYLFMLCVWCSLDISPLIGVNGQSVIVSKHSSGDPTAGESVQLRCEARVLEPGNVIEWSRNVTMHEVKIARNGMTLNSTKYLVALHSQPESGRIEILTVYNLSKYDTGNYYCRIKESDSDSAANRAESGYRLSVFYFPSAIYPICSPNGPFTAQEGTTINMTCTTEEGHPFALIEIITSGPIHTWPIGILNGETTASLQLQVDMDINGHSFECRIGSSSFSGMHQSCFIGPITLGSMTSTPSAPQQTTQSSNLNTEKETMTTDLKTTSFQNATPRGTTLAATVLPIANTSSTPLDITSATGMIPSGTTDAATVLPIAIIAGAAGGGAALLLLLLILCICLCGCKCCKKRDPKPNVPEMSPLSELIHEPISIEPYDNIHHNTKTFLESTSSFKNGQQEMIEIGHDQSVSGRRGTDLSETPNAATCTMSNANLITDAPLQKNNSTHSPEQAYHEISEFKEMPSSEAKSPVLGQHVAASPSEESDHTSSPPESAEVQKNRASQADNPPVYAEVQKNRASLADKKGEQKEVGADSSTSNVPNHGHPVYAEVQKDRALQGDTNLAFVPTDDQDESLDPTSKPTAIVKPLSDGQRPSVASKPQKNHKSLSNGGTKKAELPVVGNKRNIKKFTPKSGQLANPDNVSPPLPPPSSQPSPLPPSSTDPPPHQQPPSQAKEQVSTPASSSEVPPRPPSFIQRPTSQDEQQVHTQKDDHHEASANPQDPDENPASTEHEVMYAELDLEPDTSGKLPTPTEEPTMYATIKDMPK